MTFQKKRGDEGLLANYLSVCLSFSPFSLGLSILFLPPVFLDVSGFVLPSPSYFDELELLQSSVKINQPKCCFGKTFGHSNEEV